jgi:hypothetical protein
MQVKVIMVYDIKPGRDQEYFEFLVREFAPALQRLGLQPTESWYTMYGKRPQIMMGGIADDFKTAKTIIESIDFQNLRERLGEYVLNYQQKIIRVTPYFPIIV